MIVVSRASPHASRCSMIATTRSGRSGCDTPVWWARYSGCITSPAEVMGSAAASASLLGEEAREALTDLHVVGEMDHVAGRSNVWVYLDVGEDVQGAVAVRLPVLQAHDLVDLRVDPDAHLHQALLEPLGSRPHHDDVCVGP